MNVDDRFSRCQDSERPLPLIDGQLCDGCGRCVVVCPGHALALERGKAVVAHPDACEYAGLCASACPRRAIDLRFEIVFGDTFAEPDPAQEGGTRRPDTPPFERQRRLSAERVRALPALEDDRR